MSQGRKTKLTKECQAKIVECLELGMKIEDVCIVAGIHVDSFYHWRKRGENQDGKIYSEFADAVKKAEPASKKAKIQLIIDAARGGQEIKEQKIVSRKVGEDKVEVLEQTVTIRQAAPQWQAGAWYLERRYPNEFGRRDRVDNFNVDLTKLSDEQLQKLIDGEYVESILATAREGRVGAQKEE